MPQGSLVGDGKYHEKQYEVCSPGVALGRSKAEMDYVTMHN
jgi:hypothetical protein